MIYAVIFCILFFVPCLWWYLSIKKFKALDVIPGPTPIPILGNTLDVGDSPQKCLQNLLKLNKKYGSIFKVFIGNKPTVVVTDPQILKELLSSKEHITKTLAYKILSKWLGDGLLQSTGAKWMSRRKLITPAFHFKILEDFMDIFNSSGAILIKKLHESQEEVNIYKFINSFSLDVICETAMGVKMNFQDGHNAQYMDAVRDFLSIFITRMFSVWKQFDSLFWLSSDYKRNEEAIKILHAFSNKVIQSRRNQKMEEKLNINSHVKRNKRSTALLEILLDSEDANLLNNEDIREEIDTFMFEGHDTTTTALSFAVFNLAHNQDIQDKVYNEITSVVGFEENTAFTISQMQELKYLDLFVKESQRFHSTVPFVERFIEVDSIIGSYFFPKGTTINIFFSALHKNEKFFPDPQKFDPSRFLPNEQQERNNFSYIPFSAGPRNCIGQRFAMFEIKTTLAKILQSFRILPVAGFKPDLGMAAVLKSYNGIMVRLEKRNIE